MICSISGSAFDHGKRASGLYKLAHFGKVISFRGINPTFWNYFIRAEKHNCPSCGLEWAPESRFVTETIVMHECVVELQVKISKKLRE